MTQTLFPPELMKLAEQLVAAAAKAGKTIATAESCTGGLVSGLITAINGSSAILECGFVTYAISAKQRILGVDAEILRQYGAVSEPVAAAMASGALNNSTADMAVSVTGLAAPGGEESPNKPVGLVYIGLADRHANAAQSLSVQEFHFSGDRDTIRLACVKHSILILMSAL